MKKMFLLIFRPVYASDTSLGNFEGIGPLAEFVKTLTSQDISAPLGLLNKGISIVIGIITAVSFLYFIINFFLGGLSWITAGGDQKKIESAQKKITMSLIGLVIVVSAIFIIQIIGKVLGIGDILNPLNFLLTIWS